MPSFSQIVRFLEVERPHGDVGTSSFLTNDDLLPVKPEHKLWHSRHYWSFWLADSWNLNTFMIGSAMVGAGMTWWQAWLATIVGYSIAAGFLVLNAYPGAVHALIFPAYVRSSFGVLGGLWPVVNRACMAAIWYGVQSSIGGDCVYVLLRSIWPSVSSLDKDLSGIDSGHFLGFVLFSLASLVPIYFPLHSIRHFFTLKAIVAPLAGFGLFGWCIHSAGGAGDLLRAPATISGSTLGWVFVANLMSGISNMATLITNAVDFASRANQPRNVVLPQLIALPFTFSIVSLFGILIASTTVTLFGEFIWSPLDIMTAFLDNGGDRATRAGTAFISIGFIIAQMGTNIAANSISAGCDLTALFPRFINIRRGGYIAALVGFCMCPWNLLKDSNSFTSYLSAYSVFLSSICGVMISHYYVVAQRKLKVDDLYTLSKGGIYHYFHGFNLRAYAAYIAGIAINVVGFAGAVGTPVPIAATRIYQLSFFTGFGVSAVVYIALNKIFPTRQPTLEDNETVTVGTADWKDPSATRDSYSEDKESKEGDYSATQISPV
ncbi:NCS1 nucleoside transporter family [Leucosporidium creatinivorum]|uniref:NCS1 nucleoside transporter family n=1 Tax=Leucosporidium creatinivorum TaxID=106004 RepID=A0A1Y2FL06_9BASI|nr:NCS1 nucleoside transporter family [Leucosporidium creatinivorum]